MRERERQSRNQIALKANRDPFLEHTSGALFAEPVKVRSNDQQITEILGDYERVAPMCSGRAQTSLVGAYAMPCTPAPAYHDHDHLFTAPQPPPPQTPSRPPDSASSLRPHASSSSSCSAFTAASSSSSSRHAPRFSASLSAASSFPAGPQAAAASGSADGGSHKFQRPSPLDKLSVRSGSVSRSGSSSGVSRSMAPSGYGSSVPLAPDGFTSSAPPRVETILQEMRMPLPGMVTPLKVGHEPFAFPFSKEGLITPLHCPSNTESLHANSLTHQTPECFGSTSWPNGGGGVLSPISRDTAGGGIMSPVRRDAPGTSILSPGESVGRPSSHDVLPLSKLPVPSELSLSADLSLSEDSDDGELTSAAPASSAKSPQVSSDHASNVQNKASIPAAAAPAASSGSDSESESEEDDDDDEEEDSGDDDSDSGDQTDNSVDNTHRSSRKAHKQSSTCSKRGGGLTASTVSSAPHAVSASRAESTPSPAFSVAGGGGHQTRGSGARAQSANGATSGSLSGQDVSDSPSGTTSSGSKWSLTWIINNKDPNGTPASNLFGETPARSNEKRSPLTLPGSTDDTGSGCSETASGPDREAHPVSDHSASPRRQEIPVSDRHSHRRRTPTTSQQQQQQHNQKQKQKRQQQQQQQMSASSSSHRSYSAAANPAYSNSADSLVDGGVGSPAVGVGGSTPSLGGGGKRPRPRLSAMDQAVGEAEDRSAAPTATVGVSCSSSSLSSASSSAEEEVDRQQRVTAERRISRDRQLASSGGDGTSKSGRRKVAAERRRSRRQSAGSTVRSRSCSSDDDDLSRPSPTSKSRRRQKAVPKARPPSRSPATARPSVVDGGFLSDSSVDGQEQIPAVRSSAEQRRSPLASEATRFSAASCLSSSSDDSPPKLDADGVASSDANKRATFSRLFWHRVSGAKRGQTGSGAAGSGESTARGHERLSPSAAVATAKPQPYHHLSHTQLTQPADHLLAPPPPLPPLQRVRGVPILRCRIDKSVLCRREKREENRSPCQLPVSSPPRPPSGPPADPSPLTAASVGRVPEPSSPAPAEHNHVSSNKKRRRKRDSQREHKRSRHSAPSPVLQSSVSVSSSSSSTSSSAPVGDNSSAVQQSTADKQRSADSCSGSKSAPVLPSMASERTSVSDTATAPATSASTVSSASLPIPAPPRRQLRIESPSTGVREADSSTNPGLAVSYDSSIPAALYTNQPFPIPATSWSDARSSYLDPCLGDSVERDQNQYLKQARRLKRAADIENDLTVKVIRYTQAVLYFLLTALSMETNSTDLDAVVTMLNDTLKLIKDMVRFTTATYHKQGIRPSQIDHKLQCLLLRCQGLIYLRLYKLKETHHKQVQRQIADFRLQLAGELGANSSCTVPTAVVRLLLDCHQTQQNLQCWLEFWEQADELIQRAQDTAEFFSDIDRTMGGLSATSTLLDLVYYIRETTRRLQDMHCRQLAIGD